MPPILLDFKISQSTTETGRKSYSYPLELEIILTTKKNDSSDLEVNNK